MSFSDSKNSSWTSIAGRAEVVHDRAKVEELYSPTLKAWFPDGLETPRLMLVKIHPDPAEYWKGPSSAVGFVRAAVTKSPDNDPISNDLISNGTVTL